MAPTGWSGPVAVLRHASGRVAAGCDAPFDAGDPVVAFTDLDAPSAQCDCECEAIDPECDDVQTILDVGMPSCMTAEPLADIEVDGSCQVLPPGTTGYAGANSSQVLDGGCFPDASSSVPTAGFSTRATLCPATVVLEPAACAADEACAPIPAAPFDAALCIWSAGDTECPPELGFDARELLHGEFEDTRGCSECTCGDIGGNCSGVLELWSGDACDGEVVAELSFGGGCEVLDGEAGSVRATDVHPAAPCGAPSGAQPAGQATPTDPITLCCRA